MSQTKAELVQTPKQGEIRLGDLDSSNYVGLRSSGTVSSNFVLTLPDALPDATKVLQSTDAGILSWVAQTVTDSTKMPLAGGTFAGNVSFNNSVQAIFGESSNLKIYSDGTDSTIEGKLNLDPKNGERGLTLVADGAVTLYYDNSIALTTTTSGVDITGILVDDGATHDGDVLFTGSSGNTQWDKTDNAFEVLDSAKIKFGTGDDLELYSDGSRGIVVGSLNNVITEIGTINAAGSTNINCTTSNYFTATVDISGGGLATFAFISPAATGTATSFTLELTVTEGTVAWPASVKWPDNSAPTLTAGKTHLVMFVTDDAGTRWRGASLVDYVS